MTEAWIVMFASMFGLLFLGTWIGVALGVTGLIIMYFWGGGISLLGTTLWSCLNLYGLTAIPGFVFVGEVILRSGLSALAFEAISPIATRIPGKLLQVNIVLCAIFAAVFGSSTACAAAVGSIVIPELRKRGYKEELILGTICVAGTLAFMIPPSAQFVLYGSLVNISIGALFAAGVVPGLLMSGFFMLYLFIAGKADPSICPSQEGEDVPLKQQLLPLLRLWPLVVIMVACVGPIYAGLATPTESAGLGAIASIIVGMAFGKLKIRSLWDCVHETAKVCGLLFFVIIGASLMSGAISQLGMGRQIIVAMTSMEASRYTVMAAIYLLYIILGCLFDGISMQVMTLPFIYPIIQELGFDPVWFGVVMCLLVEIGMVTPPVGMNLFIVQAVAGPGTQVSTIFRGSVPFLFGSVAVLVLITIWPELVTWLPRVLGQM
jgi:tripartite ATP-independent transporter DctM subunit